MTAVIQVLNTATKPLRRGEAHMWDVIHQLSEHGGTFTGPDVCGFCEPDQGGRVSAYLRKLENVGIVQCVSSDRPRVFRVVRRTRKRPDLTSGNGRQNMWNVMRRNAASGWTIAELCIWASTDDRIIKKQAAYKFCRALRDAGYLIAGGERRGQLIYRLKGSRNTGPRPPLIVQGSAVYDQNTGKITGEIVLEGEAS